MIGNIYAETEWEKLRLGKITASEFHKLLTEPKLKSAKEAGELSEGAKTYINSKVSEVLTGTTRNLYSAATEWGNLYEQEAFEKLREIYPEMEYFGNDNRLFVEYSPISGGSPDAKDSKTLAEIKCPENPANHIEYCTWKNELDLLKNKKEYYYQIQFNMLACGLRHGIFVSYCPIMLNEKDRLKIISVTQDESFIALVPEVLKKAARYYNEVLNHFEEAEIKSELVEI